VKRSIPIRVEGRRSKYRAVPTVVDGIRFHSKREAERYGFLKTLQQQGIIQDLELQPKYKLTVNGVLICTYFADFAYETWDDNAYPMTRVEDVKGVKTPAYRIKKKLMKAVYGIEIQEV